MIITTLTGTHDWVVRADWLGSVRTVFTGSLFDCLRFVASCD